MAKKKTATAEDTQPTFEEALEELEAIVRRLEQGGGPLEQALSDYAQAIGLLKSCHQRLESAERRIEILSGVDAQGNPITQPLAESELSLEEKQKTRSQRRTASTKGDGAAAEDLGLF
ncbi:MAG: exodeoxyribonuclease VII small subunit [Planctomycetales bacterium]|nr:exodeoxyribonuclease VII small subunit [Planctomycetales bacterium]